MRLFGNFIRSESKGPQWSHVDFGFWIADFGLRIADCGLKTLEANCLSGQFFLKSKIKILKSKL